MARHGKGAARPVTGEKMPIAAIWPRMAGQSPAPRGIEETLLLLTSVARPMFAPRRFPALLPLFALCSTAACVPAGFGAKTPTTPQTPPAMAWDHRPEAAEWTARSLAAIAAKDTELAGAVPEDIGAWCPGYADKGLEERRAFWAGLLSAVAKHESGWNPEAVGGKGRWVGLMQIAPRSAQNYGCAANSSAALKDGAANLECAVEMLSYQVGRDGVVAGAGNRGIGRDWMPLRKGKKRAEMAAWTASQSYCL